MRRLWVIVLLAIVCLAGDTAWSIEPENALPEAHLSAVLTGEEAIPPQFTPATGRVLFWFSDNGEELRYRLLVYDIDNVLMAHLKLGVPGRAGPVLVWLFPEVPPPTPLRYPGRFSGVLAEDTIGPERLVGPLQGQPLSALREEMFKGRTFVQVDTVKHQIGELRGQVIPLIEPESPW